MNRTVFAALLVLLDCALACQRSFCAEPGSAPDEMWSLHFQATTVSQGHPDFPSKYSGAKSFLATSESATSFTTTFFLGRKLWTGGEVYINPEVSAGKGLSFTQGVAGFPNGEVYRISSASPTPNLSRLYLKQVFGLGSETEHIEADKNQLRIVTPVRRLTLIIGEFSLNDFFDNNSYGHDPRTQFLNWALMDNGAWDYAADTRGYTWGFLTEYNQEFWSLRLAIVLEPKEANQLEFDTNVGQAHGSQLELEHRHTFSNHPGTVRLLSYANRAHMGSYAETLSNPAYGLDIAATRQYRTKYGFGLNAEQELGTDLGAFCRMGWNDGKTETWAFTEIDRTVTFGISAKGRGWSRANDVLGVALIFNGVSKDHADYLGAGGYGFLLGDGALSYAPEQIAEVYYLWRPIPEVGITPDFQLINHPGYNADRGPAFVYALRLHYEI